MATLLVLGSVALVVCDAVRRDTKYHTKWVLHDDRLSDKYDEVLTERAVAKRGGGEILLEFCGAVLLVLKGWKASLEVELWRHTASAITSASLTLGEGCSRSASLGREAPKESPARKASSGSSQFLDMLG
mmetsp:Transcript_24912/g.61194  ORF Transcript_24912/g.61194 Transcript_24912/m.61194 type:complete len:130 (-) Transcript_24912:323-712(-)